MEKRSIALRDLLIVVHFLLYAAYGAHLFFTHFAPGFDYSLPLIEYIVWTGVAFFHLHSYYKAKLREAGAGENPAEVDERQAYRDGFNDAVRTVRESQLTAPHLRLDSDGELFDDPETGKRKYREHKR